MVTHPPGIWFPEETEEMSVHSERYDLTLTVLHLPSRQPTIYHGVGVDLVDTFEKFQNRQ